jgi:integrase
VGRVSIRRTLIHVDYEVQFSQPKTTRSRRSISLDPLTLGALKAHRARQLEDRLMVGDGWKDTGLVFTRPDGEPIHPQALSDDFERAVRAAGLPRIRFHDLRHTFATMSLQAGVPLWAVSDILGHGNMSVTDQFYRHAIPPMLDQAAQAVSNFLRDQGNK